MSQEFFSVQHAFRCKLGVLLCCGKRHASHGLDGFLNEDVAFLTEDPCVFISAKKRPSSS